MAGVLQRSKHIILFSSWHRHTWKAIHSFIPQLFMACLILSWFRKLRISIYGQQHGDCGSADRNGAPLECQVREASSITKERGLGSLPQEEWKSRRTTFQKILLRCWQETSAPATRCIAHYTHTSISMAYHLPELWPEGMNQMDPDKHCDDHLQLASSTCAASSSNDTWVLLEDPPLPHILSIWIRWVLHHGL